MKLHPEESVDVAMATKCSSSVSMVTEHMAHKRTHRTHKEHRHDYSHHRKSAVELLEASKGEELITVPAGATPPDESDARQPTVDSHISNSPPLIRQSPPTADQDSGTSRNSPPLSTKSPSSSRKSSAASISGSPSQSSIAVAGLSQHEGTNAIAGSFIKPKSPPQKPPRRHLVDKEDEKPAVPAKPVVPPKPGAAVRQTTPPKPGPKPTVTQCQFGKPCPPPRAGRQISNSSSVPSDNSDHTSSMASSQAPSDTDHRRFSSMSVGGATANSETSGGSHVRESRHSVSSHNDLFLKPFSVNNLSASVGVLVERHKSPLPKPRKLDKQINEVELPPRRQLHRSQSDLSSCRHSRTSSDFSDLSSRVSRTSTEVERFFNEMGIDRTVLEPMRRLSDTKQKDCLDSLSSLDSLDGHSMSSQMSTDRLPMESEQDLSERDVGSTSVVERNARIIKWLCNVKKAKNVHTKPVKKVEKPIEPAS
ncbi:F110C-like protein [Mya arenaria]|uniref:F110C-like protein n=1 Tax=Mya arenaria TaxID=6604 RepID=A0ABY7FUE4_MYAAR|nr:F110C-like protein [Mya arenaria]